MKQLTLLLAALLLTACGDMKGDRGAQGPQGPAGQDGQSITGPQGNAGKDGSNGIDGSDGSDGENCLVADVLGGALITCADNAVLISSTSSLEGEMMSVDNGDTYLTLVASRIRPGSTVFVNAVADLDPALDLSVPTQILNGGNSANGHKLYLSLTSSVGEVLCSYVSHAGTKYNFSECRIGGTKSPGTSGSGITGGVASAAKDFYNVTRVEMEVNGGSGSESVRATAELLKL